MLNSFVYYQLYVKVLFRSVTFGFAPPALAPKFGGILVQREDESITDFLKSDRVKTFTDGKEHDVFFKGDMPNHRYAVVINDETGNHLERFQKIVLPWLQNQELSKSENNKIEAALDNLFDEGDQLNVQA